MARAKKLPASHPHHCPAHNEDWIHSDARCDRQRVKICDECWEAKPMRAPITMPRTPKPESNHLGESLGLKPEARLSPEEGQAHTDRMNGHAAVDNATVETGGYVIAADTPEAESPAPVIITEPLEESDPMSLNKTLAKKLPKDPFKKAVTKKPKAPKASKATTTKPQAVTPSLEGVTIRADALTYKPDYHRARIHIKTATDHYYKLVPGLRCATKTEALAAAQTYRDQILASGELPTKGVPPVKGATATPKTPAKAKKDLPLVGVTRVTVD